MELGLTMRLLLFFWLLVCGLLTYFYPPNAIALGFVAFVLWAIIRPKLLTWRNLLPIGLTAAGAAATVLFYLREPIARLADTVYPGHRVSGGGGVTFNWWVTQLFPTSLMNDHVPLTAASNICEFSTIGSIYVLTVLFLFPGANSSPRVQGGMASLDVAGWRTGGNTGVDDYLYAAVDRATHCFGIWCHPVAWCSLGDCFYS